jgi:hypothetical protein
VAYLAVTLISLLFLLAIGSWMLYRGETTAFVALLAPSGVLTFTTTRLLRMWDQALALLAVATVGKP